MEWKGWQGWISPVWMGFGSHLFCKAELLPRPLAILWTSATKQDCRVPVDVAAHSFPPLY
jgi:hypothetical protein